MEVRMKYRRLGRTNFEVSEIGYGAWGIGGEQWLGGNDDDSVAALRRAIELGLNFIDTALAYGEGHSEELVGQIVREAPGKIFVATKVPPKNQIWPARPGVGIEDVFPYDYTIASTEQSLRNLKKETIDLQQFHVWNPEWTMQSDDWRRAIDNLKKSGKVQAFGISINDHQPDSALELIETGLIDTVQVIYNVFDQSPEPHLFPACAKHDIGVIARVPLDEGALTGTITPESSFEKGDFRGFYFRGDRKREVVEHVDALMRELKGAEGSLAEIALRFCLSNPAVSSVIPGMRRVKNVEMNTRLPDLGPLPENVMAILKRHAWDKNYYS
jgi:aryl-alcohol dehydrogenase-like predicted oxidoreductase